MEIGLDQRVDFSLIGRRRYHRLLKLRLAHLAAIRRYRDPDLPSTGAIGRRDLQNAVQVEVELHRERYQLLVVLRLQIGKDKLAKQRVLRGNGTVTLVDF